MPSDPNVSTSSPADGDVSSDHSSSDDVSTAAPDVSSERTFSYVAEMKRKALHLLALVVPAGMAWLGKVPALWLLIPSAALAVGADVLRAYSHPFNDAVRRVFGPLMRNTELPDVGSGIVINGATSVLVGATLLTLVFPIRLAAPVFAMTMIADAAAALVGRRFGRHPWMDGSHTLEGSAAFFVTGCGVFALIPGVPLGVGLLGVLAATLVEAAPLPLNDNVRVPFAAATGIALAEVVLLGQSVELFF